MNNDNDFNHYLDARKRVKHAFLSGIILVVFFVVVYVGDLFYLAHR